MCGRRLEQRFPPAPHANEGDAEFEARAKVPDAVAYIHGFRERAARHRHGGGDDFRTTVILG